MDITRCSIPKSDCLYSLQPNMEKLYTVSKNKTRSWLWFSSWTPYCKIRLKLKKVGKTTRPFRYELNQIPYEYTVEVRNRFKGLDLIDRVPDELWTEVHEIVGNSEQDHPQEKEMQKGKMIVWGGLTNNWEEKQKAKDKRKDIPIWIQSSKKIARRD